jgi:hypothetical protein
MMFPRPPPRVFVDDEDDRDRRGCRLGREHRGRGDGGDHGGPSANKFGRQRRQSIHLILGPAVFERHILALDITGVFQALAKCAQRVLVAPGDLASSSPITGIAGCCALAASGHAAAVPPSSVMNSRRFIVSAESCLGG